jgi:hypothetical protein
MVTSANLESPPGRGAKKQEACSRRQRNAHAAQLLLEIRKLLVGLFRRAVFRCGLLFRAFGPLSLAFGPLRAGWQDMALGVKPTEPRCLHILEAALP